MAIYKIQDGQFSELKTTTFMSEKIYEVEHLQNFFSKSINIIDDELLVIATEFTDWEDSNRRIDILCVDRDANLIIVELKRTKDGGHMELQAIRYAAMIANMTFEKAIKTYARYLKNIGLCKDVNEEFAKEKLLKFFRWEEQLEDSFAKDVKIILVSENFSKELTTSVLWLNEQQGIDIRCIRVKPQKDENKLYFDIQQIIPLPEATEYQVKLKEKVVEEKRVRLENKRNTDIITQLFELKKLKIGDKVILKPAIEQGHAKPLATAEIVDVYRNRRYLKRDNDDKLYSFFGLRKTLIEELKLQDIKPEWGYNLKEHWITEDRKTLKDLLDE